MNDFRFAFRDLRQHPGFSITAIVSIALAVGAAATVFAFYDGLLFRPLPVPSPGEVLTVSTRTPSGYSGAVSYQDYVDFRRMNHSFKGLAAIHLTLFSFAKDKKDLPRAEAGFLTSGNLLDALNIQPAMGRNFRADEDAAPSRDAVAIISHEFWHNEFASDPRIVGRHVLLNGIDFEIVGVTPEYFTGLDQYVHPRIFVPVMMTPALFKGESDLLTDRAKRAFRVKGRVKDGVTVQMANAEAAAMANALAKDYAKTNRGFGGVVKTELRTRLDTQEGDVMMASTLFALAGVVLLIACANVANLILVRGRARARELAIRLAIGAGRARLVRLLLAEASIIALAGGTLSLLVAQAGVDLGSYIKIPGDIPLDLSVRLDYRGVLSSFALALASALVFGVAPAFRMTKTDLVRALKAGDQDADRQRFFGRHALVAAQVAGALLLMILTTQLARGLTYLLDRSPGFGVERRLLVKFNPEIAGYTAEQNEAFYRDLLVRVRALPGVEAGALAHFVPTSTSYETVGFSPEGYHFPKGQTGDTSFMATIGDGYFKTIGTQLLAGREFSEMDDAKAPRVVIVNQFFVDHYGIKNPLGARVRIGEKESDWAQIVGVAANAKYTSVIEPPMDFIYLPMKQHAAAGMTLIAETTGEPMALMEPLRRSVQAIAPNMPLVNVQTFASLYKQRSATTAYVLLTIVGSIGLIGLGLALVGLYAVVAYQVARRTKEIGIRMAIGADRGQVLKLVLKQAAVMTLSGVGIGILLSVAVNFGLNAAVKVPAFDPLLFASVVVGLIVVTAAASLIPARRAAMIDPMVAMRQD